jgi:hypothetical protein
LATFLAMVLSMPAPPICTGLAEPMFVPGAMAARWAATVMKAPALAARLPDGPTHTATGRGLASWAFMIRRMEVSRPPGVSRRITTAAAPSAAAASSPSTR